MQNFTVRRTDLIQERRELCFVGLIGLTCGIVTLICELLVILYTKHLDMSLVLMSSAAGIILVVAGVLAFNRRALLKGILLYKPEDSIFTEDSWLNRFRSPATNAKTYN